MMSDVEISWLWDLTIIFEETQCKRNFNIAQLHSSKSIRSQTNTYSMQRQTQTIDAGSVDDAWLAYINCPDGSANG